MLAGVDAVAEQQELGIQHGVLPSAHEEHHTVRPPVLGWGAAYRFLTLSSSADERTRYQRLLESESSETRYPFVVQPKER